ncbi:response regulator transcription factor [Deinococcus sonorensis]|uniref:Response regulator transcription factor n=2 Tax=Deinococcus sonorensis TaxID=309891 RepID=A0AAU7U8B3_9DEIO
MERIRVLIADDHRLFRQGLKVLLASLPTVEVVAEAATGEEVLDHIGEVMPDVILMDLQMPGLNGIEATRAALSRWPHLGILVLTMFDNDESVFMAMRAGARGYIVKGADQMELLRAVEAVASGEALFSPSIAARVLRFFQTPLAALPVSAFPELTGRELDILKLMAGGRNNPEIARHLALSSKTVRNYISNIFSKLQVADRAQAIVKARQAGLGGTDGGG